MIEKDSFIRPIYTDINVSIIGINKDDWYCHMPGMKRDEVRSTMLHKRYDVVPIVNKVGAIKQYFTINKSNESELETKNIFDDDKIYYLTHVRDAVWKMRKERRTHYFLSNGRDENDIVGLISLSNFNCREFYVFLFSLVSYIEREFASLIDSDQEHGFDILEKSSNNPGLKEQFRDIKARFNQDREEQIENDYKEYLYLHHLIWLVMAEEKYKKLGYKNCEDFKSGTGGLKELRNCIAHPVKSLVRNLTALDSLEDAMNKLYEFKEKLDELLLTK